MMILSENFDRYMNKPEEWDGNALRKMFEDGTEWMCCPFCYKKAVKILPETRISKLPYKCSGSKCKKEFEINV